MLCIGLLNNQNLQKTRTHQQYGSWRSRRRPTSPNPRRAAGADLCRRHRLRWHAYSQGDVSSWLKLTAALSHLPPATIGAGNPSQQSTPTIALNAARARRLPTTKQSCRWWRLSRSRFGREVDDHDLSQIGDGSQIHAGVRRAPRAGGFCWIGCAGQTRRKAHVQLQTDDDPLESYQNILSVTHQDVCLLSLSDYIWGIFRFIIQIIINVVDFFTSVSVSISNQCYAFLSLQQAELCLWHSNIYWNVWDTLILTSFYFILI